MPASIFIHGLESSNQGTKSVFFKNKFPDMIIPNFRGTLHERMEKLRTVLHGQSDIRLVGSSFGGLMATLFAQEDEPSVKSMVLLAPALNHLERGSNDKKEISVPVCIYHGKNDRVIPLDSVQGIAEKIFSSLSFHVVDDDHFLHKTFKTIDWESMLGS
jgi:pimeloyl-ACP methyl ester carboxylesterase